jgi:hypothetical protein
VTLRAATFAMAAVSTLVVAACGGATAHSLRSVSPSAPLDQLANAPPAGCPAGSVVYDATELKSALASAVPGAVILMSPGRYEGQFVAVAAGTATAPITLCGAPNAVLDGGSIRSGYTLYLNGASWWRLIGFTVQGGQKGVMADHANHVMMHGLSVHDVGDEGIHLRSFSSDNTIDAVTVRSTGLLSAKFGEGIYVGSANSNWCKYSGCGPDRSDRNVIENSVISMTSAENIDIKEGTTGGQIVNNHLSGKGMIASAATAWVNVKGNGWTVAGNLGQESVKDGFQVHRVYAGWGVGNIFANNDAEVDGPGYGFYVQSANLQTVLACNNTAIRAALGLSNIACT